MDKTIVIFTAVRATETKDQGYTMPYVGILLYGVPSAFISIFYVALTATLLQVGIIKRNEHIGCLAYA